MFFRPEAKAALWRWREVLVAGALVCLGLWWLLGPGGLLAVPAVALVGIGAALAWIGVQRARFRGNGEGAGVVSVDEGQVSYLGPLTGGVVALRDLERISLVRTARPPHWQLDAPGQEPVMIPVNAANADALFDAYASLPQFHTERMLSELRGGTAQAVVIWERTPLRPAHALLH
ncbi:hypothetical protein ABMC89_08480 [Sulfitobacter sp. HNIBRBA3233]|uniref:hypothetical protein n=1 Tax=Sulfitobacter marinivivus TaxID=3158558 RepID=UPI0032DE449B